MKKKLLFVLLVIFTFIVMKPVYALEVGVGNCDDSDNDEICYTTLDEALTELERDVSNDDSIVIFISSGTYHITSHAFSVPVYIVDLDSNDEGKSLVIEGDNSTFKTSVLLLFYSEAADVEIKNLDVVYTGEFYDDYDAPGDPYALSIYTSAECILTNVYISTQTPYDSNQLNKYSPAGVAAAANKTTFNNLSINGFVLGLALYSDTAIIENSFLHNNYFSLYYSGTDENTSEITLKNTTLSRVSFDGLNSLNIEGENRLPIKYIPVDYYDDFCSEYENEEECQFLDAYRENAIYLYDVYATTLNVSYKQSYSINYSNQKSIDDVVALFRLTDFDEDQYTITSNNTKVATVDGRKINFLKTGDTTITIRNEYTNEEFVAQFKVYVPNSPVNPPTGQHILFILLGLALVGGITIVFMKRKQRKNNS